MVRPDSRLNRLILDTKYARILGERFVKTYTITSKDGLKFRLRSNGGDASIMEEVFDVGVYEKYFRPREGETVVDAGAHIGFFSLRAASLVGQRGIVYSFEPTSENYSLLQENIRINGLGNIRTANIGLSDRESDASINISSNTGLIR